MLLSHDMIWRAIDRIAESNGYSTSGLAKRAGLDPTSFNRSKRFTPEGKPRWPSTESISRVLSVTNATMAEFLTLGSSEGKPVRAQPPVPQVPVLALDKARFAGIFDENGFPRGDGWAMVALPSLAPDAPEPLYGLRVIGDSYAPLYRHNDLLLCHAGAKLSVGQRAAVLRGSGQIYLCDVTSVSSDRLDVQLLSPERSTFSLPKADILWQARLAWASQ
jgi:phage repressor protein C with HTH and peptisase S24 domain